MTTVLIIHGTENNSQGNWFPWLRAELAQRGLTVLAPDFPTPDNQTLEQWFRLFDTLPHNPADTILIGHSTGAVFVLRAAERTRTPYRAVFSVCPFAEDLGLKKYDALNASFVHPAWDWPKVKAGARQLLLIAGENDPYVPRRCTDAITRATAAETIIIPNGGHLNLETGYRTFPDLLNRILEATAPEEEKSA